MAYTPKKWSDGAKFKVGHESYSIVMPDGTKVPVDGFTINTKTASPVDFTKETTVEPEWIYPEATGGSWKLDGATFYEAKVGFEPPKSYPPHVMSGTMEALKVDPKWAQMIFDKYGKKFGKATTVSAQDAAAEWLKKPVQTEPEETQEMRGELVGNYAVQMLRELDANTHKGGWKDMDVSELMREVVYHAAKLAYSLKHGTPDDIREYAADVGNCAAMVADVAGVLDAKPEDADTYDPVGNANLRAASATMLEALVMGHTEEKTLAAIMAGKDVMQ